MFWDATGIITQRCNMFLAVRPGCLKQNGRFICVGQFRKSNGYPKAGHSVWIYKGSYAGDSGNHDASKSAISLLRPYWWIAGGLGGAFFRKHQCYHCFGALQLHGYMPKWSRNLFLTLNEETSNKLQWWHITNKQLHVQLIEWTSICMCMLWICKIYTQKCSSKGKCFQNHSGRLPDVFLLKWIYDIQIIHSCAVDITHQLWYLPGTSRYPSIISCCSAAPWHAADPWANTAGKGKFYCKWFLQSGDR